MEANQQAGETSVDTKNAIKDHPKSPPSSSSSPSHEFSFTISLHTTTTSSSSSKHHKNIFDTRLSTTNYANTSNKNKNNNNNNNVSTNNASQSSPLAIDLSPADDIFFHGHLLPLHLLSHLPVSPRSSTNSLDSFTLPIKDLSPSDEPPNPSEDAPNPHPTPTETTTTTSARNIVNNKAKPFSLFNLGRWKKGTDQNHHQQEGKEEEQEKKKMRFDMSQVIKRYMRMVRPLLFFRGRRERRNSIHFQRQPYSFSGILSSRNNSAVVGRKRAGQYSAPASMRTSPSNSGLLVATAATATLPSASSDSTMEELQAAIQAAIAHCKNSIASDRDNKIRNL